MLDWKQLRLAAAQAFWDWDKRCWANSLESNSLREMGKCDDARSEFRAETPLGRDPHGGTV